MSNSKEVESIHEVAQEFIDLFEAGWERLAAADLEGAGEAQRKALAIVEQVQKREPTGAPTAPLAECWALGGAIAAASGDIETGLANLERAAAAFPEESRYPLAAAEILLRMCDDATGAIDLCDRVLDVATEEEDLIDAVLLKAEALVSVGDRDDEAREVLAEIEGCAIDDPALWCQAADLFFALGDLDRALAAYQEGTRHDPSYADAYHGVGMVHSERGEREAATAAWLRTRELDLAMPCEPWHMSTDDFEKLAADALAELPEEAQGLLVNVPVFIEDAPAVELVAEGVDPRLFGLFSGTPLPHKSLLNDGQMPHIDSIHLYQRNLERAAVGHEQLSNEIRTTVLHETAHFFGLEDHDLEEIGLG